MASPAEPTRYQQRRHAAAAQAQRRRDRDDDRLLVAAVFCPLLFVSAYYVTGLNGFGQLGRLVSATILVIIGPRLMHVLQGLPLSSPVWVTILMFAAFLIQPLISLLQGDVASAFRGGRFVIYTAIWSSPIWVAFALIRNTRDLHTAIRRLDQVGMTIAASVYLAAIALPLGIQFGDVVNTGSVPRVFGPLGDMVAYCLLLFLFREAVRRSWWRFLFYLGPFLIGRTRGALIALVVGLAFQSIYEVTRAATARRRGRSPLARLLGLLLAGSLVGGALFYSEAGRAYIERFGEIAWIMGEDRLGGRLDSIEFGIEQFQLHPVLGIGPSAFPDVLAHSGMDWSYEGRSHRIDRLAIVPSAQNQIVQVAAESGLVGLLAFAIWMAVALRTVMRAASVADAELRDAMAGIQAFTASILLGLQSATYLLDKSSIAILLMVGLGLASRAALAPQMPAVRRVPARRVAPPRPPNATEFRHERE